jgi:transketolase
MTKGEALTARTPRGDWEDGMKNCINCKKELKGEQTKFCSERCMHNVHQRKYAKKHRKYYREKLREYRKKFPEKISEYNRRYRIKHLGLTRVLPCSELRGQIEKL